ncbi:hypothetical protein [Streptomyces sp. NPDC054958]
MNTEELCTVGTPPLHQYATPADGRTIATGLAALAWTAASAFALRGFSLRPSVLINNAAPTVRNDISPEIRLPVQATTPSGDAPDNVHPLHH